MTTTKVLIVDDDHTIRNCLSDFLQDAGFQVVQAEGADEAILIATQSPPDLILSDVVLKGFDGIALCRRIKTDPRTINIPLILMSGLKTEGDDQVNGLTNGADDYLLKPIDGKLLIAKIRTVLRRRTEPAELEDVFTAGDLTVDRNAWTVSVKGAPVSLTRKEFELLLTLLRKRGRVLPPSFLLETVWGYGGDAYAGSRTLKVHIASLRSKLGPAIGKQIINVPGVGYKFHLDN